MLEQIIMRISYRRLFYYLTDDLGYSETRAKRTIAALRKVEPRILEAFLRWFYTGKFPKEALYGIHIKALCEKRSLDPVTAFLTADWAAREPKEAKKALSRGYDRMVLDEEDAEHIEQVMKDNGWEFRKDDQKLPEDESDLILK